MMKKYTVINKNHDYIFEVHKTGCNDIEKRKNQFNEKWNFIGKKNTYIGDWEFEMRDYNSDIAADQGVNISKMSDKEVNDKFGYPEEEGAVRFYNCCKNVDKGR